MADSGDKNGYKRAARNAQKADIIIATDNEILARVEQLSLDLQRTDSKVDSALANLKQVKQSASAAELVKMQNSLREEYEAIRQEIKYLAVQNENIFAELTRRISELSAQNQYPRFSPEGYYPMPAAAVEIDYDKLARKVVEQMPVQEFISPDYIASKVAEQIVLPSAPYFEGARSVSVPMDYQPSPVDVQIDEENLADRIALKVGSIKADDFDILVDDDGCTSISRGIVDNLDYEAISAAVAEKLRPALDLNTGVETDYDEMASRISEKITVENFNEDAIADKAAAALSGYLPEIDADDIADKVASQVLSGIPTPEIDSATLCNDISDRLIQSQENHDYDIVIDEDGLGKITEQVSREVNRNADLRFDETERRFNEVDKQISELKAMLVAGAVLRGAQDSLAEESDSSYVVEESDLVTVSEVLEDDGLGAENNYSSEEETVAGEAEESESDSEDDSGDLANENGGVDFANMMKYNRSFIARIIQSTDDQKSYYGRVKTALLSYAKVNSNLSWSSERFNKGRDTIARFKIRGKTLCLYLALDPHDYPYSVYFQTDVSNNKSLHGTPMMVKIKSPLGAKKAIRLVDEMLAKLNGVKRNKVLERDYAAMYPYETIEELIEDGLVKDVRNK